MLLTIQVSKKKYLTKQIKLTESRAAEEKQYGKTNI